MSERCFYCDINPGVGIDHVVPRSKGGTRRPSNTVWACQACNSSKGVRSIDDWILSLRRRAAECNGGCPRCCANASVKPLTANLYAVLGRSTELLKGIDDG